MNGGPAFPSDYFSPEVFAQLRESEGIHAATKMASGRSQGMSLRDYIAAQVLPAIAARAFQLDDEGDGLDDSDIAKAAYATADAMLAEREKGGGA